MHAPRSPHTLNTGNFSHAISESVRLNRNLSTWRYFCLGYYSTKATRNITLSHHFNIFIIVTMNYMMNHSYFASQLNVIFSQMDFCFHARFYEIGFNDGCGASYAYHSRFLSITLGFIFLLMLLPCIWIVHLFDRKLPS